jgi:uncharacterized repeat protein (TIGR03803 family)
MYRSSSLVSDGSPGRLLLGMVLSLVVFLSPSAQCQSLKTLYSFRGRGDGAYPFAALVQAGDGNLYGTTNEGGTYGMGTVFKITSGGTLTNVYSFTGWADGSSPMAGLLHASDGNLYGTTRTGGTVNQGTVFKITTGVHSPLYTASEVERREHPRMPASFRLGMVTSMEQQKMVVHWIKARYSK